MNGYNNYKNGRNNYRNNYRRNHYNKGSSSNRYNGHSTYNHHINKHPQHPVRDAIYAVWGCYAAIGFALLWIGLHLEHNIFILIGTITAVIIAFSAVCSFVMAFKKYRGRR